VPDRGQMRGFFGVCMQAERWSASHRVNRLLTRRSTGHQKLTAFGSLRWRSGAGYLSVSWFVNGAFLVVWCQWPWFTVGSKTGRFRCLPRPSKSVVSW
jgi:hypothetical protein